MFCVLSHVLCFFFWIFENNCHGGGVLARFSAPGVRVFTFFVPGDFALSKNSPVVCTGGDGQAWN